MSERILFDQSIIEDKEFILGIDEVGWGCVAGSLVLGGALVPKSVFDNPDFFWLKDVKDSKKISDKKRLILMNNLKSQNLIKYCIGEASVELINSDGLAKAYTECINQILSFFKEDLSQSKILIDGNRDPKTNIISDFTLVVKGDDKSATIGIASNVAKEYRDNLMIELSKTYTQYDFENNVGYGTEKHVKGLLKYGFTPIHRTNSSKKLIENKQK